jgi:MoaA/NifB/PqqE/SkfB family radical SAM enzyme
VIHQVREAVRALTAGRVVIECGGIPHKFEDVPLSKLFDGLRVASSIFARAVRPWGLPTHLQIEPTNACNLRCAVCPVTEGLNRPAGFMDFDLYRRLLDEVGESVFLILLWDWGEPFLHPRICELISYAKGKGIQFISSTNGRPFAQPGLSERVVRSGLDTLIFSIDGIRQDTYERFRGRGTLEVALEGLRSVAGAKRALNSRLPLVSLSFIVTRHNEHEVSELPSFARSLGVDALTLKTLNP